MVFLALFGMMVLASGQGEVRESEESSGSELVEMDVPVVRRDSSDSWSARRASVVSSHSAQPGRAQSENKRCHESGIPGTWYQLNGTGLPLLI